MSPHFRLKKLTAYPDWHKKPFLLNRAEMANPYIVLDAFFDYYDLSNFRVVLKQWLDDAINKEEAEAASHYYAHERISKLVEAAWVIMQQQKQAKADEGFDTAVEKEERSKETAEDDEEDEQERERFVKWVTFPASLKGTPLLYMKRAFEVMDLDGLELAFSRWQKIALAADYERYSSVGERADLIDFCEGFVRLLEASYVLGRSAEWDTEGRTRWVLSEEIKYDLLTEEQSYRISEEEIGNPLDVIKTFFQTFSPAYARRELWDLLACAVEYKGQDLKRLDMLLDYECLHAILEAAWLYHNRPQEKEQSSEEAKTEGA